MRTISPHRAGQVKGATQVSSDKTASTEEPNDGATATNPKSHDITAITSETTNGATPTDSVRAITEDQYNNSTTVRNKTSTTSEDTKTGATRTNETRFDNDDTEVSPGNDSTTDTISATPMEHDRNKTPAPIEVTYAENKESDKCGPGGRRYTSQH